MAKHGFSAAQMIAKPVCTATTFVATRLALASFSIAPLSRAAQRPMMIFRPRLSRQKDQPQNHEAAIAAFQSIAAAVLPNRHGLYKNTKVCEAADQASPLPAPHKTAKRTPILTPRRVPDAIQARFNGLHDRFDKSFVNPSLWCLTIREAKKTTMFHGVFSPHWIILVNLTYFK